MSYKNYSSIKLAFKKKGEEARTEAPWMPLPGLSMAWPSSLGEAQPCLEVLAAGMFHGQPVDGGQVHLRAWWHAELQLMQQDGQEEEDLPLGWGLPYAPAFAQAEQHGLFT